jgi:hypothetical protein
LVKYKSDGCPIPEQRTISFCEDLEGCSFDYVDDDVFYNSEDEDCNDHFFTRGNTIADGISKGILYPYNEK